MKRSVLNEEVPRACERWRNRRIKKWRRVILLTTWMIGEWEVETTWWFSSWCKFWWLSQRLNDDVDFGSISRGGVWRIDIFCWSTKSSKPTRLLTISSYCQGGVCWCKFCANSLKISFRFNRIYFRLDVNVLFSLIGFICCLVCILGLVIVLVHGN